LATGAYCIIELHNFARWNGKIIGQSNGTDAPTDDQFAGIWKSIAAQYANKDKIIFELINEPHDLDVPTWARSCKAAVQAIRNAGANTQMILLPGTSFDSAAQLVSSGSADQLLNITNPDGSTKNLLLDIHKYLDTDNSGTHAQCTTDNVDAFNQLATYLRGKGRQGFISETGASNDATCVTAFCNQNKAINANSDVFVGLVGWGAGSFDTGYLLSMTPVRSGNQFTDKPLLKQCMIDVWNNAPNVPTSTVIPPAGVTTTVGGVTTITKSVKPGPTLISFTIGTPKSIPTLISLGVGTAKTATTMITLSVGTAKTIPTFNPSTTLTTSKNSNAAGITTTTSSQPTTITSSVSSVIVSGNSTIAKPTTTVNRNGAAATAVPVMGMLGVAALIMAIVM
jgi:endoglucanase